MGIAASPGPFWAYSSGPQTKENRWICEAPMQDRQGSGVAVSHQNHDIFNSDRFPHAFCGTLMLPWRRRRQILKRVDPLQSWGNSGVTVGPYGRDSAAPLTFQHYRRARVEMSFGA